MTINISNQMDESAILGGKLHSNSTQLCLVQFSYCHAISPKLHSHPCDYLYNFYKFLNTTYDA